MAFADSIAAPLCFLQSLMQAGDVTNLALRLAVAYVIQNEAEVAPGMLVHSLSSVSSDEIVVLSVAEEQVRAGWPVVKG
jgi:hypothetical protein